MTLDDDGIGGEGRSMDAERDMAGRVEGTLVPVRTEGPDIPKESLFQKAELSLPWLFKSA